MNPSYVSIFSIASMMAVMVNSAVAQDRVQAGTLVCNTSMELGVIVGSREALNCTFTPSVPGPTESYSGTITKLGLDLGVTTGGVIVWLVYAPTSLRAGELAGTYAGGTAEATIGVGLGANVLVGGSNRASTCFGSRAGWRESGCWFRRITTPLRALIDRLIRSWRHEKLIAVVRGSADALLSLTRRGQKV
jgi:hypothetical protein